MSLHRSLFALPLLLALACSQPPSPSDGGTGGGEGGGEGGGGAGGGAGGGGGGRVAVDAGYGPVAIGSWCDFKAQSICGRLRRCGAISSTGTFNNCVTDTLRDCDGHAYATAVAGGRLTYDAQKAADCLNGYARGSCALDPAACKDVFVGQQAANEGCVVPEECAPGSFCYEPYGLCPFVCKAYQPVGALCNYGDLRCDDDTGYCDDDAGYNMCFPRKALGDSCLWFNFGECPLGSSCATVGGADEGICVTTYAKAGEACRVTDSYPLCDQDSFCRQEGDPAQQPQPPGVCAKRVGLGGTCRGYGYCQQGLRCSGSYTTGTCIPLGKEGDICNRFGDCEQDLVCDDKTSRCARYPGDGGTCSYYCDRGLFCDFNTDTCVPKRPDGELCQDNSNACMSECTTVRLPDAGYERRCLPACSVRTDGGL